MHQHISPQSEEKPEDRSGAAEFALEDREFIASLGGQWQQQQQVPQLSVTQALKSQRQAQWVLAAECTSSLAAVMIGLFFVSRDEGYDLLFNIAGVVLITTGIVAGRASYKLRKQTIHWEDLSPEGLLEYNAALCLAAMKNARYLIFSSTTLLGFSGFIFIQASVNPPSVPSGFQYVYAAITLPLVACCFVWAYIRLNRKSQELSVIQSFLADYQAVH